MPTSRKRKGTGKITKKRGDSRSVSYEEVLDEELRDLDFAAGYLTACLDEGDDVFYLGIQDVARANGGMKALSKSSGLNRESLYDMLSRKGNPLFTSVRTVLDSLGLELSLKVRER